MYQKLMTLLLIEKTLIIAASDAASVSFLTNVNDRFTQNQVVFRVQIVWRYIVTASNCAESEYIFKKASSSIKLIITLSHQKYST